MPIQKKDVKHIAKLARLKLTDKEIDYFSEQLGQIIGYIDQLKEVNTSSVEPTSHVTAIRNIFRADSVKNSLKKDNCLKNIDHMKFDSKRTKTHHHKIIVMI